MTNRDLPAKRIATHDVWVWVPPYWRVRVRGVSNATLEIRTGCFVLRPKRIEQRVSHWDEIEYTWPAVVLETLLPWFSTGLLLEMSGRLGRVTIGRAARADLERAGFAMIGVRRWGYEAPRPVDAVALGEHVAQVPRAVVANVG